MSIQGVLGSLNGRVRLNYPTPNKRTTIIDFTNRVKRKQEDILNLENISSILELYDFTSTKVGIKNKIGKNKIKLIEMINYHSVDLVKKILSKQFGNRINYVSIQGFAQELGFSGNSDFGLIKELTIFNQKYKGVFESFLPILRKKLII